MKQNKFINLKSITVLSLSLIITIWLSVYRTNSNDRFSFELKIPDEVNKTVIVDIGKLNPIKYYLQPGTISLYGNIQNSSGSKNINVEFTGIEAFVSQGSKKSRWIELKPTDSLKEDRRGNMRVSIEMRVPRNKIRQRNIANAKLSVKAKGNAISTVDFAIVNTKY